MKINNNTQDNSRNLVSFHISDNLGGVGSNEPTFILKFPAYLDSHRNQHKLRKYVASKKELSGMDKLSVIPFLMIGKPKHISKGNLSWPQAKRRLPMLNPYSDSDKDGVINLLDSRPFNKKKRFNIIIKGGNE